MAITFTRQVVTTGTGSTNIINNNFAAIQTALANALSRIGTSPNHMNSTLDMNSNRIINLPSATTNTEPVTYAQFAAALTSLSAQGWLIEEQTATEGQTEFTLTGVTYTPGSGNLGVYINGVRQHPSVYSETSDSVVTLSSPGAQYGDKVLFEVLSLTDSSDSVSSNLVTHIASGTGAIATTAREKLREIVSVKDFGAVGDGSADDSGQVEAAVAALAGTGRILYFPAGTYKFTRQQLFHRMRCIGDNAVLKFVGLGASEDCVILQGSTREYPLEFSGFTVDANSTGRDAVVCSGGKSGSTQCDFLKVSGVYIKNAVRDGLHMEPSLAYNWLEDFTFSDIRIYNSGRHGIAMIQPDLSTTFMNQGLFTNVEVRKSGMTTTGYEVYVDGQGTSGQKISEITWINCEFDAEGGTNHGIHSFYLTESGTSSDFDGWVFIGCTFEDVPNTVPGKTYAIGINSGVTMRNPIILGGVKAHYTDVLDYTKVDSAYVAMANSNHNWIMLNANTASKIRWGNGATDTIEWESAGYLKTTASFQASLREKRTAISISSGLVTIVPGFNKINLSENITGITFPTGTAAQLDGQKVRIQFTQDGIGGKTVAGWPAAVLLAGGSFTPTSTASKTSHIDFIYERGEAKWYEVSRSLNI